MGLFSGFNLIRFVCTVHLIAGYLLIFNPKRIADNNTIGLLGQAVGVQPALPSFYENRLGTSLAGIVLVLSAITDLTALSNVEEVARDYWGSQGIIRCGFFASIAGYIYAFKPGRWNIDYSAAEPILNSVVFAWAFFEAMWWFGIHTQLREERGAAAQRIMQRRKMHAEIHGEKDD